MADYQWKKAIGRMFRSKTAEYMGIVSILGIPYEYHVIEGVPKKNSLLEVVDFCENGLYVKVIEEKEMEKDGYRYID